MVNLVAKVTNKDRYGNILDIDQMLKKLKREVDRDGILDSVKKHEYFVPKSVARKLKSQEHRRLMRKLNRKQSHYNNEE